MDVYMYVILYMYVCRRSVFTFKRQVYYEILHLNLKIFFPLTYCLLYSRICTYINIFCFIFQILTIIQFMFFFYFFLRKILFFFFLYAFFRHYVCLQSVQNAIQFVYLFSYVFTAFRRHINSESVLLQIEIYETFSLLDRRKTNNNEVGK